jgi:hypothetical protein
MVVLLPMPINVPYRAVYAVSISAIKKERVNSVEDGDTDQRGAKESHLSRPNLREKGDVRMPASPMRFYYPFLKLREFG